MVQIRHGALAGHFRRAGRILGLAVLTAGWALGPVAANPMSLAERTDQRCRAGAPQQPFKPSLTAAKAALKETGALTIIALGSSTTAGAGASHPERSYPAVLEAELQRRIPDKQIKVLNKGIGGQSAHDMYLRLQADAIDEKPALVIWQTVVNDAIRDVGEAKLAKILRKGIGRLQEAGIDLVLMDLQWLPREDRYPKYEDYRAVLAQTAAEHGVSVFPRYEMMKGWARSKMFSAEELVGVDGLHMVDVSYRCLAIRLADGIAAELTGTPIDLAGSKPN